MENDAFVVRLRVVWCCGWKMRGRRDEEIHKQLVERRAEFCLSLQSGATTVTTLSHPRRLAKQTSMSVDRSCSVLYSSTIATIVLLVHVILNNNPS
jgi:hypothetical protein